MHADRQRRLAESDHKRGLPRRADQAPVAFRPETAAAGRIGRMSPAAARSLQRTIGNAAVARLVEQERHQHGADCDHGAATQRFADDQAVQPDAMAQVDAVTRTSGSPMQADVQRKMESDFGGEDFSDVRVHVDRSSTEALGAKAYTTKTNRIVFRSTADMDDHTMRHELQHVRQQRVGRVPSGVSHPTDALERDAESTATRLGQEATGVQRATAGEHSHTPVPAPAQDGAVQRMVLKTSRDFYQKWAGEGPPLTSAQKTWVWEELRKLTRNETELRKLPTDSAVKLLTDNSVTRDAMNAELGHSASAAQHPAPSESMEQYEEQARAAVLDADRAWRAQQSQMPELETATFNIEGLGRGTVAMLKSPSGPRHSHMLSWFSHGYEDKHRITVGTERQYGFAVQEERSLNRIGATAEVFASLPDAFANAGVEPTKNAPGEYVRPHHATELSLEIDRVIGLVDHCDVAVLLDFQWSDEVAAQFAAAKEAETPPLPVIIENAQAFKKYNALLIYACRTPWSVNAAVEGSKKLKENLQKELMAQEKLSADEAKRKAEERYEASPRAGEVYQ
ncbi:eCIS core domain-containing protein [Streptomyces sp. NPDC004051]